MIQLRNKSGNIPEFTEQAVKLCNLLKPLGVPLIINDRAEVAKDSGADGVHVGQGDMTPVQARAMLGPNRIIGITAFKEIHFKVMDPNIVNYAGTGPFYPTKTDKGKPVLGPGGFSDLVKLSKVPVVGIGGIAAENAGAVIESGAAGVAMMRSVSEAENPEQAVRDIAQAVAGARLRRAS